MNVPLIQHYICTRYKYEVIIISLCFIYYELSYYYIMKYIIKIKLFINNKY